MAKPYRMVGFRGKVKKWFMTVGAVALKRGYLFHCEHLFLPKARFPWHRPRSRLVLAA